MPRMPPCGVQGQRPGGGMGGRIHPEAEDHGSFRTEIKLISRHLKSVNGFFNTVRWSRL